MLINLLMLWINVGTLTMWLIECLIKYQGRSKHCICIQIYINGESTYMYLKDWNKLLKTKFGCHFGLRIWPRRGTTIQTQMCSYLLLGLLRQTFWLREAAINTLRVGCYDTNYVFTTRIPTHLAKSEQIYPLNSKKR